MLTMLTQYTPIAIHYVMWALLIIFPLLACVAYLTLTERRVIAWMQLRRGPNVVGPFGLLQPIADAIKLMNKEVIIPAKADKFLFLLAPCITFICSLVAWAVIPFGTWPAMANINVGVLYILAISSLGIYGIIIAGWASNSKYAFLGAIRSAAQMISYEICISMAIVCVLLATGSLNLTTIVLAQQVMPLWIKALMLPMMIVFFVAILAETNRHPFDLPEAESELVAGYNVEYSSMTFALFFLGEYANMILTSALLVILFWSGWLPIMDFEILYYVPAIIWFGLKVAVVLFLFLWIRATFPRYRYDQLMRIGWKFLLPLTLFWVMLVAGVLMCFNALPRVV